MNTAETANIIIYLRRNGWTEEAINDFIIFIETNKPTAEQAEKAKAENNN